MAAHLLTPSDIRSICIKRVSGATQKSLAEEYHSSVDRIGDIQKRNKDIMNMFVKSGDLKEKPGDKKQPLFVINSDHKTLLLHGELLYKEIEVTGDKADGTIICQSVWQNEEPPFHLNELFLNEDDFGVVTGKLVIGTLISPDCPSVENGTHISKKEIEKLYNKHDVEFSQWKEISEIEMKVDDDVINAVAKVVAENPIEVKHEYIWNASNKFISISFGRDSWNADDSHPKFREALELLFNDEISKAVDLINIEKAVTEFVEGKIKIENGVLRYENYILTNGISKRIVDRMQAGEDFKFFIPFLNNLMENPSEKAVNRLFDFLEANDIEITEDGYFLAYKKVGHNYFDLYTNSIDNSPNGPIPPSVPRNQVDEDDNVTCSRGLHVCAKSYLSSYGGNSSDKVVLCKVHPKDVVAIPKDYKNAKMRTCGYTVIKDVSSKL